MSYCPRCRFEYRPGITHCPECGEALLAGSPPPPEPAPRPLPPPCTESVRLCRVGDPTEAKIIRAALAEAGIPSAINTYGPIAGSLLADVADGAPHDYALILVAKDRLVEAQRVLTELQTAPVEWPEGMEPDESSAEGEEAEE